MSKNIKTVKLYELKENSPFKFNDDKQRVVHWFGKMDGMYGSIFKTQNDMEKSERPSFINGTTLVEEINE